MRVAVVGGGAIGASVAMFLRRLGGAAVEVVVIEPDPALTWASSSRSASSIRQQFSNAVNVRMSQFGLQCITDPRQWLEVDGEVPELGFVESGYLFLATGAGVPVLRANHAVQLPLGAPVALLDAAALRERCRWLRVDDIALASLGAAGEGWFDGPALAGAMARKARSLGAVWRRARVVGFERSGARLVAARLDDGSRIGADTFVNAAGPWAASVAELAGVRVDVRARRRTVFMLDCPTPLPRTPLVIDPRGVWFRSEGSGFLAGWSPGARDPDPDDLPLDRPDLSQFDERVWPVLADRVPAFEALRVRSAWAGYYEVHPLDHNGIVGPHAERPNFILACGFSGHGLQHAPAVGRGVAELVLHGRYDSLDLGPLGHERVAAGRALVEHAVI